MERGMMKLLITNMIFQSSSDFFGKGTYIGLSKNFALMKTAIL
jgi:hypothetical protein